MNTKKVYEAPNIEKTVLYKRVDSGNGFLVVVPCQHCAHSRCHKSYCDCFVCRLYDDTDITDYFN